MKSVPEFKFKGVPLCDENVKLLRDLIMNKSKEKPLNESELSKDGASQIFLKRIKVYDLKFMVTDFFFAICMEIFINNPAKIIMLLKLCYQYWRDHGTTILNIETFCKMFPFGTPSDDELKVMWVYQKWPDHPDDCFSDNLLDYPESWLPDTVEESKLEKSKKKKVKKS